MKRTTWVLAAAAVLAAVAAAGGVAVTSGAKQATAAAQPAPANTAQVQRRTLSATVPQDGTLTYRARSDGSPYSVINQARGTYTKLPTLGQVIPQGHVLYRVNDRPVVLLYGSTPAYRTLSAGASGPDVAELNADLVALGYATRAQLSRTSASFGSATTTAVEKLQAALGVTQTGTLTLGQAVFEPTAVRVTSVVSPARGRRPGRRDGDAGHLDHSPGAGGAERLATDRRGGRGQGEHHPAQQPDHPGCRLLGGDGRHLPIELRVGRVGIQLRRAGNGHLLVSELGEQHTDDHRGRHPVRPGRDGHVGSGPGAGRHHHRQRAQRAGGAGDRAAGPVRRGLRRRGRRRRREQPSRAGLARTVRRRRRAGAGHRLGAGRRPRSGGRRQHDPHPATHTRQHRGRGRQRLRDRRRRGAGARCRRRDQELSRRAARPGPARR